MRLSNEGDQKLIRSAVSDAAASLLSFIPSLGTREVFTFGSGVALPTRMRFAELAADKRPNSEASGNTRSDAGTSMNRDLLTSVIERWRTASMSHRMSDDDVDFNTPFDAPSLQPAQAPVYPAAQSPTKLRLMPRQRRQHARRSIHRHRGPTGGLWSTAAPASRRLMPRRRRRTAAAAGRSALQPFEKAARRRPGRTAGGHAEAAVAVQVAISARPDRSAPTCRHGRRLPG